uniref:Protein AATF n=1 Tax=Cacopsylla melanoneura TaxID=428564 RepID=A0A8D9EFC8_9HEMI
MKAKKSSIREEIDSQFGIPQHQEDIDDFENPIADAVKNLISDDIQTLNSEDISDRFSSLRTRTFNDGSGAKGKSTSRNKLFKDYHNSLDRSKSSKKDESDLSMSEEEEGDENEDVRGSDDDSDNEGSMEAESELEEDDDEVNFSILGSEDDGDETLDDSEDDKEADDTLDNSDEDDDDEEVDQDFLYSKQSKSSEIEKGKAVQQQIALWDSFLECRIRLQKGIVAFNKLPSQEVMDKYSLGTELHKELSDAQESVSRLTETLISLHEKLCNQYEGVGQSESKKRKSTTSDKGGVKKRKLEEYDSFLNQMKDNFVSYQNDAIQKWNDKTKIASGKTGNSNFSAFDQSVLNQIEHILKDKARLVRRTQQRKSKYVRVGELGLDSKEDSEEALIKDEYDVETFDDDDFYHKILRDYIEKKTVDINDPQKLGKQWMELQKLRSKMKRKVDVKCTKGRKLRYGVHEKLVNFMAPVLSHQWNLESEIELFKSLFGKKK